MSERKPLIAVMGAHKLSVLYNENPVPAAALNETYANAVTRAGGIPVILPPFADDADLMHCTGPVVMLSVKDRLSRIV